MKDNRFKFYVGPECQGHFGLDEQGLPDALNANLSKVTIAFIAEKGARDEVRQNRPLIGFTGKMVRRHAAEAHIPEDEIWLSNSVHNFNDPDANPSDEDVRREQIRLFRELSLLPNLRTIVPLGQHALNSLGGFRYQGILKWRGSLLRSLLGIKMVPTLHPSFYSRGEWRYRPVVQFDINRAAQERLTRELVLPTHNYYTEPTYEQALEWLAYLEDDSDSLIIRDKPLLMLDLEMFRSVIGPASHRFEQWFMSCFGASKNARDGFCIPFMRRDRSAYWSRSREATIRIRIQDLLLHPDKCYGTQGGATADCWWLRKEGIFTPFMDGGFDTMYAHRLLAPDLPHALHFLCSIYTRNPYYKDESGKNEKDPVTDKQYWEYNAKDTTTQAEVAAGEQEDLRELGLYDFFCKDVQSLWGVISDMIERGMRVDFAAQAAVSTKLKSEISVLEADLNKLIGWNPNPRSRTDMGKLLENFGIVARKTEKGNIRAGEDDLLAYANHSSNTSFKPIARQLIEIKSRKTLLSNFIDLHTDRWGYYHATYDPIHAKTLRLSSSGDGTGPQLQNVPKKLRHLWIPDPGCVMTLGDLKQAEAMVVAWDAEDFFLMEAFKSGQDVHCIRGCVIYRDWYPGDGIPPSDLLETITRVCPRCADDGQDECVHSERFVSKVSGHAFAYLLGVRKFINHILLPVGVFMNEKEAKRIRSRVVSKAIERWQQRAEKELQTSAWAVNAYGLKREFYGYIDEELVRALLSWKAQSVVACITNRAMRLFHNASKEAGYLDRVRITNQMHDSLAISHPPDLQAWVSQTLEEAFNYTLWIHGRELRIPLERKDGIANWAGQKLIKG